MRLVIHLCKQDTHPPTLIPIHYIQQTGYEKKTQTYQEEVVIFNTKLLELVYKEMCCS